MTATFQRGVAIISIDTELMWGYRDTLSEAQFQTQYPDSPSAHAKLLSRLAAARVSATWFVVGALTRPDGVAGHDGKGRLWEAAAFVQCLRDVSPAQEIAVHGGLTHQVWTHATMTREIAEQELKGGIDALAAVCPNPCSFSFPRNCEAFYDLLPRYGLHAYRGRPPALSWRLGRTLPGAILRVLDELRRATPPAVMPYQAIPGLWNIPASMFLYPIGPARTRIVGLRSRVERFQRGIEAAARQRAIFHFCLHPENLAESPHGVFLLDDILDVLLRARRRGDVEILTMRDVLHRLQGEETYVCQEQHQYSDLLETHRRG